MGTASQRIEFSKPATVSAVIYTEDGEGNKRSFPYIMNESVLASTVSISDDGKKLTLELEITGPGPVFHNVDDIDGAIGELHSHLAPITSTKLDLGVKDALIHGNNTDRKS